MQDRAPLYPGRIILTPVAGQANTYDMVRADQPTQDGTPLNKATFWKDATAALFGLGVDSVPDDGFAWIGKYAQHWWRRRKYTIGITGKTYFESEDISLSSSASAEIEYSYSKDVVINSESLEISLNNPSTVKASYNTYSNLAVLKGHYVTSNDINTKPGQEVCYIPEDADIVSYDAGSTNRYRIKTPLYASLTAGAIVEDWEYVQSSDRSAYPDSGKQDGYEYEYIGIPFDNAVGAPKIEIGSYIGTGTYGVDNPNSLALNFIPKVMLFFDEDKLLKMSTNSYSGGESSTYPAIRDLSRVTTEYTPGGVPFSKSVVGGTSPSGTQQSANLSGFTKFDAGVLSWYVERTSGFDEYTYYGYGHQFNAKGTKYLYVILG